MRRWEYVYFLRCGKYIKIGISVNPMARLRRVRCAAAYLFGTKAVELIGAVRGTLKMEAALQAQLRAHQADIELPRKVSHTLCGGRLEWFHAKPEVMAVIDGLRPKFVNVDAMYCGYSFAKGATPTVRHPRRLQG